MRGAAIGILLGIASIAAPRAFGADAPGPPLPRPAPVHADVAALERAVVDATLAFIRSDLRAAREALDRADAGCRRLRSEEDPSYPSDLVTYDQAFHTTIDMAREFSTRGALDRAFDQFVWMQKACRTCHEIARGKGFLPPTGSDATPGPHAPRNP